MLVECERRGVTDQYGAHGQVGVKDPGYSFQGDGNYSR